MKLFVPICDNGGGSVMAGWAVCMITELAGPQVHIQRVSDSHANRACNKMAGEFLKSDCDFMLIIDADIVFRRKDIERIIGHAERGVRLVYGIYPKKHEQTEPCLCTFDTPPEPDEHGLALVRRAGRGFLMVDRALIEAMKEENDGPALRYHNHEEIQWDFFPSGPVTGELSALSGTDQDGFPVREWISEDWYFCERARALGVPTLVDTGIALGHIGPKEYRFGGAQITRLDSHISSWRDIHGWFDYELLYRELVAAIPDGGRFVEVGSWQGRSLGAFHAFAKEAGKHIFLNAVDTFDGQPDNHEQDAILRAHGGSVAKVFCANMKALGLNGELTVHQKRSTDAAAEFSDASADAIFIDAAHDEVSVREDIAAWLPKLRAGGILAGHDYDEPGVCAAVDALLPVVRREGRCWVFQKPLTANSEPE